LLVQSVAAKYPGRVNFVSENFGASKLAEKFGVKGYPAVFVDGVLVASPREFGYFGEVEGSGRYAPWRNETSQAKFRTDLTRMIDLILAGHKDVVSREHAAETGAVREATTLPRLAVNDLAGRPIAAEDLSGRVVLVEFWATWCVPCRSTLGWLGELKQRYGDKLAIVALAVESPEPQVREMVASLSKELRWAITDAPTAQAFGDITAVPTLFVFDRAGKAARVFYGAPPGLHDEVTTTINGLMSP
jgi:thiol-disulfide isomerase/thioredoxin